MADGILNSARARSNGASEAGGLTRALQLIVTCLVSVTALAGCRPGGLDRARFVRRELPGASLLLPVGTDNDPRVDYAAGRIRIDFPRSNDRTVVEWRTGEMLTTEELEALLVKPLLEALANKWTILERGDLTVAGARGVRYLLGPKDGGDGLMTITTWSCGKRWFSLVAGPSAATPKAEERIRQSFTCKPDPARDGKTPVIGVQLPVGPDFGVVTNDGQQLLFTSLGGEALLVAPIASHVLSDEKALASVMPSLLRSATAASGITEVELGAMTDVRVANETRKLWRGRGKVDGSPVRVLASLIPCGKDLYMSFYMGAETEPDSGGRALVLGARCSTTPSHPRPFPEVAREACARGDRRGCP